MRILIIFSLLLLSSSSSVALAHSEAFQLLDNQNWEFSEYGTDTWYKATVPGVVHLDLMNNNLIPDPFYRDNVNDVQWVENATFEYRAQFLPHFDLWAHDEINLVFTGLDTHALVLLNGQAILAADNMWRTWKVDVKSHLVNATNNLTIIFTPAVLYDNTSAELMLPVVLPCENSRIYSRKAQYHYGWDWGPRLVTAGIWKSVYLEGWTAPRIQSAYFVTRSISKASASIDVEVVVEKTASSQGDSYRITVEDVDNSDTRVSLDVQADEEDIEDLSSKKMTSVLSFKVPQPKLWWVRNLGTPHLYNFKITLSQGSKVLSEKTYRIGIRHVKLIQEYDEIGRSFKVRLNGKDVFMKGANYIPSDMFLPRITDEKYRKTIEDSVKANYNMLRVWGGGTYEADIFYDLCDEAGILLFHDLMFAGGMYPGNASFLRNVEEELTEQITRLRNHPSIAFWNGNNEIQEGWDNWGWKGNMTEEVKSLLYGWFEDLFLELAPSVIAKVDYNRDYVFTSPRFGYGHNYSLWYGDSHFWAVWVMLQDIELYNTAYGRFSSEYGMQGVPSFNTIQGFTIPSDWNLSTPTMKAHQRHATGYQNIQHFLWLYYRTPVWKTSEEWMQKYCYTTQVMQKYAMQTAIESHRRNQPHSMGTLVWQLNDVWPVVSWSSVDSNGNWKALHYAERKLFENVLISFYTDSCTQSVRVYVVNDNLYDIKGKLRLELLDFNGKKYFKHTEMVKVSERTSGNVLNITLDTLHDAFGGENFNQSTVLRAHFIYNDAKTSENLYYFSRPKALQLPRPHIKVTIKENEDNGESSKTKIILSTDKLAYEVYLFHNGTEARFSDNFFDLLPGKTKVVYCENLSSEELKQNLKVFSMYDTYN